MKSAFELTMERLQKNAPTVTLSESQKNDIAEIESAATAKIAEKELLLNDEIAREKARGNYEEILALQKQLTHEIARIRETAETKKQRVREQTS